MSEKRRPLQSFKSGVAPGVTVNIWPGKESGQYTFTIQKRYKDASGEWRDSSSLFHSDMAAVTILAARAIDWADNDRAANHSGQYRAAAPAPAVGDQLPLDPIKSVEINIDDDDIPF